MRTSLARFVVFFTLLLSASNANALDMRFDDGANIDDDPINDIVVAPGEMIVFANRWTDQGTINEFNGFEYLITYDPNELTLEDIRLDKNNYAKGEDWFPIASGQIKVSHPQNSNNNALSIPFFGRIWRGDEFTFKVVRPKNDGLPDYSLQGFQLFTNAGIVEWPAQNIERVEVQPVPAPLPILPLFVMWSQIKKLRRISCRLR